MNSLVTIGNFDGLHRGHQTLLANAEREAHSRGLALRLLTFDPHPALVLGRTPPPLLTTSARKRELALRVVPDLQFVAHPFSREFAAQSPAEFASWLAREQQARHVLVGANFRFGKARVGDFAELSRLGGELGFSASCQDLRGDQAGAFSSTRVRQLLSAGDASAAHEMLGRPHCISGEVVHGKKLGRTIGFPTANLSGVAEMLPASGIYAVVVDLLHEGEASALGLGAMSVGKNPTTDSGDELKAEVFLFDCNRDLYGQTLRVGIVERLRAEERFDSLEALVEQMKRDVARARALLVHRFDRPPGASYL